MKVLLSIKLEFAEKIFIRMRILYNKNKAELNNKTALSLT
jgi:hypothetical protein